MCYACFNLDDKIHLMRMQKKMAYIKTGSLAKCPTTATLDTTTKLLWGEMY